MSERKKLLSFLFEGSGREVTNIKFFRGPRDLVSQEELCEQVHSAFMQKRMGKAVVAEELNCGIAKINVRDFLARL